MANYRAAFQIDDMTLNRIWEAQGLGTIHSSDWAGVGVNNPALVINDRYVIRFDGLINQGISRFHGEQRAYAYLREAGIPCPEVLILDDSKSLVAYDYMIMTKVAGIPLRDTWTQLTSTQQQQVAYEAGQILARIHLVTLPQFGRLYGTGRVFDTWSAYIMDSFERCRQEVTADGLLTPALGERMQAVLDAHRPLLESVRQPRLVHWDYHFGNLLQQDGKITAVLDLEWALGGDPVHDFNRRSEWEEQCPGSSAWIYSGYTDMHPLDADHETRVALYEMLWFLDCVIDAPDAAEADLMRNRVLERVLWLEENR